MALKDVFKIRESAEVEGHLRVADLTDMDPEAVSAWLHQVGGDPNEAIMRVGDTWATLDKLVKDDQDNPVDVLVWYAPKHMWITGRAYKYRTGTVKNPLN